MRLFVFLGLLVFCASPFAEFDEGKRDEQHDLSEAVTHTRATMMSFAEMLYSRPGLDRTQSATKKKLDDQECVAIAVLRMIEGFDGGADGPDKSRMNAGTTDDDRDDKCPSF